MLLVHRDTLRLIADAEEQRFDALAMGHGLEGQMLLPAVMDREPVCPVPADGIASVVFVGHPGTVIRVSGGTCCPKAWSYLEPRHISFCLS